MPKEVSAGVIIFRRNREIKYLLLHREAHERYRETWDFSSGNVEAREGEERAARREAEEETGIKDLEFIPDFKEKTFWFYRREGKTIYKEVVYFLAETKTEEVKVSTEHSSYEWLTYDDAKNRLTFKNAKVILEKAYKFLSL